MVTNVRHYEALKRASEAMARAREGLDSGLSSDLFAMDVRQVLHYLGEITGEITTDEILGNIFANFCIGK
jgi:tRNA modification GTPase